MPTWEEVVKEKQRRHKYEQDIGHNLDKTNIVEVKIWEDTMSRKSDKDFYGNCDHPGTMENGTATLIWVVLMIVSALFKHGWIPCILETIIWLKFITRHEN